MIAILRNSTTGLEITAGHDFDSSDRNIISVKPLDLAIGNKEGKPIN